MFKHVSKQRKLAAKSKEAVLSDEETSGSDAEQLSLASHSDSDSNSDSESDDDVDLEDDELDTAEEESEELLMPPPGYPSVEEALTNPIALPKELNQAGEVVETEGEGPVPVCVVCPTKALKHGRMTEVHVASKDHLRRHARFVAHVKSDEFPSEYLDRDAESLSAQLDALVLARATAPAPSTSKAPEPQATEGERLTSAQINAALKAKATAEGRSKREVLREARQAKNLKKRNARNEKRDRLKAKKAKDGKEGEVDAEKKKKNKKKVYGVKPTPEQIAARQEAKIAKRNAEAAAKGLPAPEAPIHPTPKTVWPDQLEAIEKAKKEEAKKVTPNKKRPRKTAKSPKA